MDCDTMELTLLSGLWVQMRFEELEWSREDKKTDTIYQMIYFRCFCSVYQYKVIAHISSIICAHVIVNALFSVLPAA